MTFDSGQLAAYSKGLVQERQLGPTRHRCTRALRSEAEHILRQQGTFFGLECRFEGRHLRARDAVGDRLGQGFLGVPEGEAAILEAACGTIQFGGALPVTGDAMALHAMHAVKPLRIAVGHRGRQCQNGHNEHACQARPPQCGEREHGARLTPPPLLRLGRTPSRLVAGPCDRILGPLRRQRNLVGAHSPRPCSRRCACGWLYARRVRATNSRTTSRSS